MRRLDSSRQTRMSEYNERGTSSSHGSFTHEKKNDFFVWATKEHTHIMWVCNVLVWEMKYRKDAITNERSNICRSSWVTLRSRSHFSKEKKGVSFQETQISHSNDDDHDLQVVIGKFTYEFPSSHKWCKVKVAPELPSTLEFIIIVSEDFFLSLLGITFILQKRFESDSRFSIEWFMPLLIGIGMKMPPWWAESPEERKKPAYDEPWQWIYFFPSWEEGKRSISFFHTQSLFISDVRNEICEISFLSFTRWEKRRVRGKAVASSITFCEDEWESKCISNWIAVWTGNRLTERRWRRRSIKGTFIPAINRLFPQVWSHSVVVIFCMCV